MLYMIDAYKGVAHVTPEQVGDYNVGITGGGCVFNVGEKLRAEVVNSNKIRIYDGAFLFQGRRSGITPGSYEDVTIENGTQAQKRNDIIAAKYIKDGTTSKENISLVVIKGTPGTTATDPNITDGNIRGGDSACYMPLYRVKLNGINIEGVEQLFKSRKSFEEIEAELTELNDNLSRCDLLAVKASKSEAICNLEKNINGYKFILLELMYAYRSLATLFLPLAVFCNGYIHNASAIGTDGTRLAASCGYVNDTQVKITTSSDDVYCRLYGIL